MGGVDNSTETIKKFTSGVGNSGRGAIESRFETLIEAREEKPFDWYKKLDLDKSDASKIRRGLLIPPEWLRIRIAGYFKVDSSVLWKLEEIWDAEGGLLE